MAPPLALLTNDDGIASFFLHVLVEAVAAAGFRVAVAAPSQQQSWIGRAISRRRPVAVEAQAVLGHPGWAVDGTPTDTVNIALHHLLDERPAIVIAGLNIGFNTGTPLVFSSGTVAAALEGAAEGLPAIAASQMIPREWFDTVSREDGACHPVLQETLRHSAAHVAAFARRLLDQPRADLHVHNLNYPFPMTPDTPMVQTSPARHRGACYFETCGDPAGGGRAYRFARFASLFQADGTGSDRDVVLGGQVSHTILNFSALAPSNP